MAWRFRLDVADALSAAGWTGDALDPLGLLRHPSGAVWAVVNDAGGCGLDVPGSGTVRFPGSIPSPIVIAACLAASSQAVAVASQR